jgi:HEPN domain-containing protein
MTLPDADAEQRRRAKSERYFQLSQWLLKHAQQQLDRGDTMQASEKAYGAVAHAVKACGERRGWNHFGHCRVEMVLDQLRDEWDDPELVTLHGAVKELHNNYFEYEISATRVRDYCQAARSLTEKLAIVRNSPPRPLSSSSLSREQRRRLSMLMQPPTREQVAAEDLPSPEDLPE